MSDPNVGSDYPQQSAAFGTVPPPVRHSYPLAVRDAGLGTAIGLMMRSLPYAAMRLGVSLAYALGGLVWIIVAFGGAAFLGLHVAGVFGVVWLIICVVGAGWFWGTILRYVLHLIECGHVAVLTELITRGQVGNGSESMFEYGKRVVMQRFGQINLLYAMNLTVRGIIGAFHRTLDWVGELLPIPGLEGLANLANIVLRAATRYLDQVIFSYNLARNDGDPWRGAREGIIYYCQNAKPILKTSALIVALEYVLTFVLWIVLLVPAGLITLLLPSGVRETGGIVTILIAALLAWALRTAVVKPIFLIMMMVRFHSLIENQPINEDWDAHLSGLSDKFRTLGMQAAPNFRRSAEGALK